MNASELRIGNWIYERDLLFGNKVAIQVKSSADLCNIENLPNEFEPIQLDEEWLQKFGFDVSVQTNDYIWIDVNDSIFVLSKPEKYLFTKNFLWEYRCGTLPRFVELEYVHQLQNLFFVLTGKELTIKNDKQ
ncbi:MAG: hypothetical protein ACOXZV_00575 [Bacteroidales bacterium]|jgi:hypothetical protein